MEWQGKKVAQDQLELNRNVIYKIVQLGHSGLTTATVMLIVDLERKPELDSVLEEISVIMDVQDLTLWNETAEER